MEQLLKKDFYFDLPEELIAQDPLTDRSSSRLLVLDKESGRVEHHIFKDIIHYLEPGDCLVLNNTKVIPARLIGHKEDTGAAIEVLLLKHLEDGTWETLVKPGKKARPGARIVFGDGLLTAEVEDIMEGAEKKIFNLMQNKNQKGYTPIKDVLVDSFTQLEELYNRKQHITGVPTGFADLDYRTAGLHGSELILVAARPAMGKSAFA